MLRLEVVIPTHPQFGGPPVVGYTGPPIDCNLFVSTTHIWKKNLLDQESEDAKCHGGNEASV